MAVTISARALEVTDARVSETLEVKVILGVYILVRFEVTLSCESERGVERG